MSVLALRWRRPDPPIVTQWRGTSATMSASLASAPETPLAAIIGPPGVPGPPGSGGGGNALNLVEVDLGTVGFRSGKFVVGGLSGLVTGSRVRIEQALGPYSGKGTLADEYEMDALMASGTVTSPSEITAYWNSAGCVLGNFKFLYDVAAPALTALRLSQSTVVIGRPATGTISGVTDGSAIVAAALPTGFSVNGAARSWAYDGTGVATIAASALTETLTAAFNSPRVSATPITVVEATVGDARIVMTGDSISVGGGGGGGVGAINRMSFPASVAISNLGTGSSTLAQHFSNVVAGNVSAFYQADRPCAAVIQGGTNDIGTNGTSGAVLYDNYAVPMIAILKAQGFRVLIATLLPRSDAFISAAEQIERTEYNARVMANAGGADVVLNLAGDAYFGAGSSDDLSKFADKLHPTAAAQAVMAGLYQTALDPLVRAAPRAVTTIEALPLTSPIYAGGKFGQGLSGGYGFVPVPVWPVEPPATFTVEAWLKTTAATFGVAVGQVVGSGGAAPFSWYFGVLADGKAVASTANTAAGNILTSVTVNDGVAHHFRFVVKPGGGDIYVDGVLCGTSTVGIATPTRGLSIQRLDNMGFAFNGVVDGITLFSGDKSALPVPIAPYPAGTAGMIGYFPMDGHGIGWR